MQFVFFAYLCGHSIFYLILCHCLRHIADQLFHLDFEEIRPFIDGNGRTERLLMNGEPMQNGYPYEVNTWERIRKTPKYLRRCVTPSGLPFWSSCAAARNAPACFQEPMELTQSGLSCHMKILCDSGLVVGRQEGKWTLPLK